MIQQMTFLKLGQFQIRTTPIVMLVNFLFFSQVHTTLTPDPLVLDIKCWSYHDGNNFKLLNNLHNRLV